MTRQKFDDKIINSKELLKNESKVSLANSNIFSRVFDGIGKKILTVGIALTMVFSGLALTGCNDKKPPQQENPPIVDPIEPEEPEKPGPVEPDPDEPEKPGPVEPDPDEPIKTPEEIQKEKEEKIAQNIYAAVEAKLKKRRNFVDKVLAMDYGKGNNGSNYVYMLVRDANPTSGTTIDLLRFPMETEMTEENILSGNIKTNQYDATIMLSESASVFGDINSDTSKAIYEKVKSEDLLESQNDASITAYVTTNGDTDSVLGGYSIVHLYTINQSEIEKNQIAVKSDVYENNAITDHLINGTYNKTFKMITQNAFYHKFSDNALVDYEDGLNYQKREVTITIDGKKVGTYNNGRVYMHFEEENE